MIFRLFIFVSTFSNEAQNTLLYLINSFQDDISDTDFCDFWEVPCSLEPGSQLFHRSPLPDHPWVICEKAHVEATPRAPCVHLGEKILALYLTVSSYLHAHMGHSAYIKGEATAFGLRNLFSMWKELWHHQVTGALIGTFSSASVSYHRHTRWTKSLLRKTRH